MSREHSLFEYEGEGGEVVLRFEAGKKRKYECGVFAVDLKLRGEATGYKAVFEKKEFVAIVGSGYSIVPNCVAERRFEEVVTKLGYEIEKTERSLGRIWVIARNGDRWLFMRNAIDGSSALRIEPGVTVMYGNIEAVLMLPGLYRKHTQGIDKLIGEGFEEHVREAIAMADEINEELSQVWDEEVRGEVLELLLSALPKKYVEGLSMWLSSAGKTNGAVITYIARKIFAEAEASMDRKRQLYRMLLAPFEIFEFLR